MAKIYLSSTYHDLVEARDVVYKALRRMHHDVIAMEDYLATGARPLDQCLNDIASCDLYIGIFAWCYGFVPPEDNPAQKSITELEYRKAQQLGQTTLVFVLDKNAPWPPPQMDMVTGENNRGASIIALREELGLQKTVSFFQAIPELAEKVSQAVSNWEIERLGGAPHILHKISRQKYLEQLYAHYQTVKLPIGPPEGLALHAIFQQLKMRSDPLAAEDRERKKPRPLLGEFLGEDDSIRSSLNSNEELAFDLNKQQLHTIVNTGNEALEKSPLQRIVILGGPGTGKTTTLKYLVGERAAQALDNPDAPLPIFLSLDDFARSDTTLQQYLVKVVEELKIDSDYADIIWKTIQQGKAFICLDSLDEVKPELRPKVIEKVNAWAADKGNTWIVGSRFTEYKGGQFTRGQFAEWEILSMDHLSRLELAQNLLPELQKHIISRHVALSATEFVRILEQHPRAAAWGENPLLFSLAAVVFLTIKELPPSRAILYREVIEAILKTRDADPISNRLLQRVLAEFSLWLYQHRGRSFSTDDLSTFLFDKQHMSWGDSKEMAHRIISTGIIEVVARDTYAFRHQTFQEYLVAVDIARRLTDSDPLQQQEAWHQAWSKRTYSRWTEILRLMVGVLTQTPASTGRRTAHRWLKALLAQRAQPEGDPGSLNLALALKSLCEVSVMEEWTSPQSAELEQETIQIWIEELVTAARLQRNAKAKRLVDIAHDISLLSEQTKNIALDQLTLALKDRSEDVRVEVVRALGGLGAHAPLAPLFLAIQDHNYNVIQAAQEVLNEQSTRLLQEHSVLKHEDARIRRAAITALGKQGERAPLEVFINALNDENSGVRYAAIIVLGEQRERVSLEVLTNSFNDVDSDVQSAAIIALGTRDEQVPLDMFTLALKNENSDVREAAITALGKQGIYVPLDILTNAFKDVDSSVRRAAISALGKQGERVPLEVFINAFKDEYVSVRQAAITSLGEQGDRVPLDLLTNALKDEDSSVRSAAISALGKRGESIHPDIFMNAFKDEYVSVRQAAITALGKHGEHILLERMLQIVNNRGTTLRIAAVETLGEQRGHASFDILTNAFKDIDSSVRRAAIIALGEQGDRVPLDMFTNALTDESSSVRRAAITALGEQGDRVPLDMFTNALTDESSSVQSAGITALGKQGERVPLDVFTDALKDENSDVRYEAITALSKQGERVPLDVFINALKDVDKDVQSAAITALGKQGERVPLDLLTNALKNENSDIRYEAITALGKQGERVPLDLLTNALTDEDSIVRSAAITALGKQGERVPLDLLINALTDEEWSVRQAAITALGKQGERAPLDLLMNAINDENSFVRSAVITTLGKQGERVPLYLLMNTINDESSFVRGAAITALQKRNDDIPYETLLPMLGDNSSNIRSTARALLAQRAPELLLSVEAEAINVLRGQEAGPILGSLAQGFVAELLGDLGYSAAILLQRLEPLLDWHYWPIQVKAAQAFGKIKRNIPDHVIKRLLEMRNDPSIPPVARAADDALAEILSLETGIEDA